MKIKLILLCLVGLLSGCMSEEGERVVSSYPKATGYDTMGNPTAKRITPLRMSFEGHDYIIFYRDHDRGSISGAVHDPDCSCFKK